MDRFELDKANGKLMGVCAGLARSAGFDLTMVRVLAVLSILVLGPISVFVYLVTGWVAPERA